MSFLPHETFPALETETWLRHAFFLRAPHVDVKADRAIVLERLEAIHRSAIEHLGFRSQNLITAEQVHGSDVASVNTRTRAPVPACDGLVTNDPGVVLGIYVADCGPIYLADPVQRVIALLHSGKKGTAANILQRAVDTLQKNFHSQPADLLVQLGPCIRPPHYEIDFAATIRDQARAAGIRHYYDCGYCTASAPGKYYSYRRELGQTGRLLAILGLHSNAL